MLGKQENYNVLLVEIDDMITVYKKVSNCEFKIRTIDVFEKTSINHLFKCTDYKIGANQKFRSIKNFYPTILEDFNFISWNIVIDAYLKGDLVANLVLEYIKEEVTIILDDLLFIGCYDKVEFRISDNIKRKDFIDKSKLKIGSNKSHA